MNEHKFLTELGKRAYQQKSLRDSGLLFTIVMLFGTHPWRIIIPLSLFLTVVCTTLFKIDYVNAILWIFGGLP